jgi:hypothetical protein
METRNSGQQRTQAQERTQAPGGVIQHNQGENWALEVQGEGITIAQNADARRSDRYRVIGATSEATLRQRAPCFSGG